MAAGYSLVISATDKATAPIRAVNKSLTELTGPIKKAGEELKKLGEVSGMASVARSLGALTPALGALTGVASVAGVIAATTKWASYSQELGFAATRAGMTATALAQVENAVRLAGGSAAGAAGGMTALKDTMFNVRLGRAGEATFWLNKFNIGLDNIVNGTETATTVLPKLANAISGISDPTGRAHVAELFFGSGADDMLKLFAQGPAGMRKFLAEAKEAGGATQGKTREAIEYMHAQTQLALAAEGLGNSILAKFVAGGLTNLMGEVTGTLETIMRDVDGWDPPPWFKAFFGADGQTSFLDRRVLDISNAQTADALSADNEDIARMNGGGPPPAWWQRTRDRYFRPSASAGPPTASQKEMAKQLYDFYISKGVPRSMALGIIGNFDRESSLNPNYVGPDSANGATDVGLGNWQGDRLTDFARIFDHSMRNSTWQEQAEFAYMELIGGKYGSIGDRMRRQRTPGDAGEVGMAWEGAAGGQSEAEARGDLAEKWAREIPDAPSGHVQVDVLIGGAVPPGTTGVARPSGAARAGTVRVEQSGVGR